MMVVWLGLERFWFKKHRFHFPGWRELALTFRQVLLRTFTHINVWKLVEIGAKAFMDIPCPDRA